MDKKTVVVKGVEKHIGVERVDNMRESLVVSRPSRPQGAAPTSRPTTASSKSKSSTVQSSVKKK